ncbi:ATP-binding protein [Salipiger sp. PrR007]|uniref:HD domain-containing protein n=1 Tax=Salipiger sp. PrR007 TaxID=2706884 RepID=UPI0013B87F42|nr:ATP-binding protein [Salipiger sp. PrR007]NDW33752.1 hypothetical protein [Salipiger sp. PrR007]
MGFMSTRLWREAFEVQPGERDEDARNLLKQQLLSMRDKVAQLVAHIPADCKGLTVHDVTHLDALWEAADLISGDNWKLNPAEAFVFGAAALVHDAGLTTLSYANGRAGLRETLLWKDAASGQRDGENEDHILFEVLRNLHAEQASTLCRREWASPISGTIYLIEDSELRQSFGEVIGRVAHSHHWSASRVQADLQQQIGGSHKLPPDWTLNERKLACLIRCADAAQVDRTRAPLMTYAALGPTGYSDLHWKAQAKLNRLTRTKDAINFTSSSPFSIQEADSWWIAYDLALVLDAELKASNAILGDMGEQLFTAGRVSGVTTPADFSERVRTDHWRPIDASVRISNPLLIAKTLGGRNLYGMVKDVPFRELIQNSVDAIRAKRAIVGQSRELGKVSITIDHYESDEELALIQIDDDGIGMSENVISTALVDFGKSFWNSDLLKEEFPGLKSKKVKVIGKFGIGFFSVFEMTERVKVASRRYDQGLEDINVLDFRGLASRPLLMRGSRDELPYGINTRVTLIVAKSAVDDFKDDEDEPHIGYYRPTRRRRTHSDRMQLWRRLRYMCAFLDVSVSFKDNRNGSEFSHSPNLYSSNVKELTRDLEISEHEATLGYFDLTASLKPIKGPDGDAYGIAALDIISIIHEESPSFGVVSVGGIISSESAHTLESQSQARIPYIGVAEARTERAARDQSTIIATYEAIDAWLEDQFAMIDTSKLKNSDQMQLASFYYQVLGKCSGLPFTLHQGEPKSISDILPHIERLTSVYLPVSFRYDTYIEVLGYSALTAEFFEAQTVDKFFVTARGSRRIFDNEDDSKRVKNTGSGEISFDRLYKVWPAGRSMLELLSRKWGSKIECRFSQEPIFSTTIPSLSGKRWVLILSRGTGS